MEKLRTFSNISIIFSSCSIESFSYFLLSYSRNYIELIRKRINSAKLYTELKKKRAGDEREEKTVCR